jgi:rhodanese-related sulfurtransferase
VNKYSRQPAVLVSVRFDEPSVDFAIARLRSHGDMKVTDLLRGLGTDEIKVEDVEERRARGALLVDVREMHEWNAGHSPEAIHIPLGRLAQSLNGLPKDRELLFICHSGNRSGVAAMLARRAGYRQARNVQGGMLAWARAGLSIEA